MIGINPEGMGGRFTPAPNLPLEVVHEGFLIAIGDGERVEVLRSPLSDDDCGMLAPVREFIAQYGLVMAARETFPDGDWMWGQVEVSVYVPPAVRAGVFAGTHISLPWAPTELVPERLDLRSTEVTPTHDGASES